MQVFSKEWFLKYQKPILWYANTWLGRRTLRLHGHNSEVGNNKIVKILPNVIFWIQDDLIHSEFRTHNKYAKRLYYSFKWIWHLVHFWDMQFANKVNTSLNLGFDTLTVFPDANTETTSVDGYVAYNGAGSYAACQSATSASITDDSGTTFVVGNHLTGGNYLIYRGITGFDTSALTDGTTIVSAALNLYRSSSANNNSYTMAAYEVTIASNTSLTANDYNSANFGGLLTASVAVGSLSATYTAFNCDSNGIAYINDTGVTNFGWRFSGDVSNSTPTGQNFATMFAADETGTSKDPYLYIIYGTPDPEYRVPITIDDTKVAADHTDFPVYVSITLDSAHVADANGYDVHFKADDETTELDFERVSYDSGTGLWTGWVRVPSLAGAVDTLIYAYYGNSLITTDQSNANGVFTGDYQAVFHLENNLNDSSGNGRNGTNNGSTNTTSGKIGQGRAFVSASSQNFSFADVAFGGTDPITVSAWVYADSYSGNRRIFTQTNEIVVRITSTAVEWILNTFTGATDRITRNHGQGTSTWYKVDCTYSAANGMRVYINGAQIGASGTPTGTYANIASTFLVGGTTAEFWDGRLDEVRLLSADKGADWILTEYNNQNDPATFYSVGTEEFLGDAVVTSYLMLLGIG